MTKLVLRLLLALSVAELAACGSTDPAGEDDAVVDELTSETNAADAGDIAGGEADTEAEIEEFGEQDVAADTGELPGEEVASAEETPPPTEELEPMEETFDEEVASGEFREETDPIQQNEFSEETGSGGFFSDTGSASPDNRVTAINYIATLNGGTVEIKTTNPAKYSVRPNPNTNQYVIEIENSLLADSLKRPYIMKDFEGSFGAINAYQNPNGTTARVVLQMKSASEPVISQEGNSLLVVAAEGTPVDVAAAGSTAQPGAEPADTDAESYDVKAASKDEKILAAQTLDEFLTGSGRFFGRPISIQTNDADVRDVISFIAEESGVNLVISDDVEGKVSVKLRQVPWDQALVIVMRSRGLGYVRQGNVLRITKLATLQAEANAAKDIVESQKRLTPLKVKVIPVSYASVTDLATQVKPFLTLDRGQVVSDARTSSIIITDTADVLMRVERLVRELDIPPAQVMIESKIVEATETFNRRIGVNWSLTGAPVEVAGSGGVNGTPITFRQSLGITNFSQDTAQNGFLNMKIGTVDFLGSLNATLSLAQADNLVRIISSPRIVTMNKEKSLISQKGEVITIQSTTNNEGQIASTPIRTPVELKLEVTPQITNEGSVVLEVNVLRQFAGAEVDSVSKARPVNSREAKTKVLVPNGQTAVIGGIYQSDESESETGVPGLKDIPIFGWLFKQRSTSREKTELLLFLTPRILNAKDQSASG